MLKTSCERTLNPFRNVHVKYKKRERDEFRVNLEISGREACVRARKTRPRYPLG